MPQDDIVRKEEILQLGKDYPLLGRVLYDTNNLDWTHRMHVAVKTLVGVIKSLSVTVREERKKRRTAEDKLSTLKQAAKESAVAP